MNFLKFIVTLLFSFGNISAMATDIAYMATISADRVVANAYKYDQLNRINNSYYNSYNNTNSTWTGGNAYATSYSYDMNGNIRHLNRSEGGGNAFDALAYQYNVDGNGRLLTDNKLGYVIDGTNYTPITTDIKTQGVGNYTYDGIGNLVSDNSEGNMNITWNVYGKIKSIRKGASAPYTWLDFSYDGGGNRVSKNVGTIDGSNNISYTDKTTYVRDASGNIMATYDDRQVGTLWAQSAEYPMYGSSRLGVYNQSISNPLMVAGADDPSWLGSYQRVMRLKNYEFSDHLGNVIAVISDWKIGVVDGSNNFKYYSSDVVSATDYYPFGMTMPGRLYNGGGYRYGFDGMEKDDEISGVGNAYTTHFRHYDPRLGRWGSVDPEEKENESQSSYCGLDNNPIKIVDPNGDTGWDILAGILIGGASNLVPYTITGGDPRELYHPTDPSDYNNTLQVVDNFSDVNSKAAMINGAGLAAAGTTVTVGSGGTLTVVAAPVAVVGVAVAGVGAVTAYGTNVNKGRGYNYGEQKPAQSQPTKEQTQNNTRKAAADASKVRQENVKKGIPESQLGPSGKPKVHNVEKPNLKQAKDAARNNPKSNSQPIKHTNDLGQKTHYHSTQNGQKLSGKDNIHYVNRASKITPFN